MPKIARYGVDFERAVVAYLVFHPQFEGMNFTWQRGKGSAERASATLADILRVPSPFLELQLRGIQEMRYELDKPRAKLPYAFLEQLQRQGFTDYFALFQPFGTFADRTIWPDMPPGMKLQEGVTGSLGTKRPGDFTKCRAWNTANPRTASVSSCSGWCCTGNGRNSASGLSWRGRGQKRLARSCAPRPKPNHTCCGLA